MKSLANIEKQIYRNSGSVNLMQKEKTICSDNFDPTDPLSNALNFVRYIKDCKTDYNAVLTGSIPPPVKPTEVVSTPMEITLVSSPNIDENLSSPSKTLSQSDPNIIKKRHKQVQFVLTKFLPGVVKWILSTRR
jgi:hypothetical protein